jgi:hypothetical protein
MHHDKIKLVTIQESRFEFLCVNVKSKLDLET